MIDEALDIEEPSWKTRIEEIETRFLRLRSQVRELEFRLASRTRIQGDLEDLNARIRVFEESDHRNVLIAYRRLERQIAAFRGRREELTRSVQRTREAADDVDPRDIREADFNESDEVELEALGRLRSATQAQRKSAAELRRVAASLESFGREWKEELDASKFQVQAKQARENYDRLKKKLADADIGDPTEFGSLIQRRQSREGKLSDLERLKSQLRDIETEGRDTLKAAEALRLERSKKRREFLLEVLANNPHVRISLIPFGNDPAAQEEEFRKALGKESGLQRDILSPGGSEGILADLYQDLSGASSERRR